MPHVRGIVYVTRQVETDVYNNYTADIGTIIYATLMQLYKLLLASVFYCSTITNVNEKLNQKNERSILRGHRGFDDEIGGFGGPLCTHISWDDFLGQFHVVSEAVGQFPVFACRVLICSVGLDQESRNGGIAGVRIGHDLNVIW